MHSKLRILHLEDDPDYAELVRAMLASDGLDAEWVSVTDGVAFSAALASQEFDIILSDYHLPGFNGLKALNLVQQQTPATPFILISGTVGEQAAIESLKCGATDYVLKQWSDRLVPAVKRAVREAAEHRNREKAEQELARRESYFRALTENVLDILTLLDRDGLVRHSSPSVKRVLGYEPSDLQDRKVFDLVHPEDAGRVREAFDRALRSVATAVTVEFRIRHRQGTWRHLEAVGQNLLDDPNIGGVVVTSRDVTDRKHAEVRAQALARLGGRLSAAITTREAALVIADVADELLGWDAFALDLWDGQTETLATALAFDEVDGQRTEIPEPELPITPSPMARCVMDQGAQLFLRNEDAPETGTPASIGNAESRSESLLFVPVRNGAKIEGVLTAQSYRRDAYQRRDLETLQILADHCSGALERIRTEQALRETEQRFSGLFKNSPDAIFVEDLQGKVLDVNPAACQLHGMTRDALIGRSVCDLCPPEAREQVLANLTRLANGELQQIEGFSLTTDGRRIPVEVRTNRIEFGGQPALLLHVRDLTERRRAEAELQRNHELYRRAIAAAGAIPYQKNYATGRYVFMDEGIKHLTGYTPEELRSATWQEITLETVFLGEAAGLDHAEATRRARTGEIKHWRTDHRIRKRTGEIHWISDSSIPLFDDAGHCFGSLGIIQDITDRRRLEEQLRQSQKMDAIGQLAGGVAHDFNNILTIIQGHSSLLLSAANLNGVAWRSAQQISQAAERAAGLTRQLLTFSRRQVMQPCRLDLNEVVNNLTKMLGRILGEDIALQLHYCPQPPLIMADASMVEQVLLNLVVNSRDAMPKGGQLSLQISIPEVDPQHVAEHPEAHLGKFVCLSATDTGCGIPPGNLRRIFEPFFTTKEVGKGTGLGLATVYGVIQQHQGWIEVDSTVGRGTTFRVYLPLHCEVAPAGDARSSEPVVRGGHETILVVEDEHHVRELVCSILECHGYTVLQAPSGPGAVEVWSARRDEIDLLLTDLVMPDRMNGRELAERLWKDRPDLKVIFTSGYSADVVGKEFVLRHGLNYLQKPYHPQKLALTIREVLDKAPAEK